MDATADHLDVTAATLVTEVEDIVNVLRPIIGQPPPEQPIEEPGPAASADAPPPTVDAPYGAP